MMNRFAWSPARTVAEAGALASVTVADVMATPGPAAVLKAGGIDLLDLMKEGVLAPALVVSLTGVPGLNGIDISEDGVRIGAMVTLAELAAHSGLRASHPALTGAAGSSASPQLRHVATLGGNLLQRPRCWYFRSIAYHCLRKGGGHCFAIPGENQYHAIFANQSCAIVHPSTVATVLVALGATVEIAAPDAPPRQVTLDSFFVAPDQDMQRESDLQPHEVLTAVLLPKLSPGTRMAHLRQGQKAAFDWPLADVAVVLDRDGDGVCRHAAVVLGAASPVPHRATAAEAVLVGARIDEAVAAAAGRAALHGATPLSGNAYKLPLFETLVRRAIVQALAIG